MSLRSPADSAAVPALEVRWRGRIRRFAPDQTVRIGSGTHAHIRDDAHLSLDASHATLRVVRGVWQLTDHSTSGTRVAGQRLGTWIVDGLTVARFGAGSEPLRLELEPARPTWRRAVPRMAAEDSHDELVAWRAHREATNDLTIVVEGVEHVFEQDAEVTVGSLDSCEIRLDTDDVTPVHLRFRCVGGRWVVEPIALDAVVHAGIDRCDRPRSLRGATGIVIVDATGVAHELTVFAPGLASGRRRLGQLAFSAA